jgi:hypothetical protein
MVDFSINSKIVKNRDIELILQQIDILFDTTPREVFGSVDYGTKYDSYLYRLKLSNESIKDQVLSDLNSLQLFEFKPTVEVHLLQGTEQDIALIEITLTRESEVYNRVYKIS